MRKWWLPTAAAVVLGVSTWSMGAFSTVASAASPELPLTVGITTDPAGFDPQATAAASTFEIAYNIYDSLATTNAKGQIVPDLATSWTGSDHGQVWTFHLRGNVHFSNGQLLTATTVKDSFARLESKSEASPWATNYKEITSIDTPNTTTVVFHLAKPYAPFLADVASPWAGIVPENPGNLKTHPVGTGPYELQSWIPGQQVVLVKNPHYFRAGLPKIPKVIFKVVPDPQTMLVDLRTGEIQVVPQVPPQDVAGLKGLKDIKVLIQPSGLVQVLAINEAQAPFNKLLVRKALNYAVNKQAVIQGAVFGYGVPIGSHMPPNSPYYVNLTGLYHYNVAYAKKLLAKAGYPHGFKTTIYAPQPYQVHVRAAQIIAQQLAQVGITANVDVVPWGTWLNSIFMGRHYGLTVIAHTAKLDPDTLLSIYESTNPQDYMNYKNPTYDKIMAEATATASIAKRKALYAKAQRMLAENATAVYLETPDSLVATRSTVHNWQIYPIDVFPLAEVTHK